MDHAQSAPTLANRFPAQWTETSITGRYLCAIAERAGLAIGVHPYYVDASGFACDEAEAVATRMAWTWTGTAEQLKASGLFPPMFSFDIKTARRFHVAALYGRIERQSPDGALFTVYVRPTSYQRDGRSLRPAMERAAKDEAFQRFKRAALAPIEGLCLDDDDEATA